MQKKASQLIAGPVGNLELICSLPKEQTKKVFACVCHPHPLHGGTMDNKVVYTLARAFESCGIPSIRFNYRGVGRSEGEYAHGVGEADDLQAVLAWARQQFPDYELALAGFSFGAYVALRGAQQQRCSMMITVAPAVVNNDYDALTKPDCRWVVVQGDGDEIVSPQAVYDWHAAEPLQPELIKMNSAGHFFHGHLVELRESIKQLIENHYQ